jgi:hypothetical protein
MELLWRHVTERSHDHASLCPRVVNEPGNSKVNHADGRVSLYDDIRGLNVAVNYAVFMCVLECASELHDVAELFKERNGGAPFNQMVQTLSVQVFHDEERHPVISPHLINGHNIGMVQASRGLRFSLEAIQMIWFACDRGRNRLNRDQAANEWVARQVDHAHRAAPQFAQNFVFADSFQR